MLPIFGFLPSIAGLPLIFSHSFSLPPCFGIIYSCIFQMLSGHQHLSQRGSTASMPSNPSNTTSRSDPPISHLVGRNRGEYYAGPHQVLPRHALSGSSVEAPTKIWYSNSPVSLALPDASCLSAPVTVDSSPRMTSPPPPAPTPAQVRRTPLWRVRAVRARTHRLSIRSPFLGIGTTSPDSLAPD